MNTAFLKARQTRYGSYVVLYTAVILAVLVVLNLLAKDRNKSYDSTSNKRFTLSDQSVKLVRELNRDVKFLFFSTPDQIQQGRDLLDRYDVLSPRLGVSYIDVDQKPQIARAYNITRANTTVVEVGTRREEAGSLTEEDVTSALIRALKEGQRTVCIVQGTGEVALDDQERNGAAILKQLIERNNYKSQTISLIEKAEIPKACTAVVVDGPRVEYTEPAVNVLKSYVESGGRVLLMLGPSLQLRQETVAPNKALLQWLAGYGVTLNADWVIDPSGVGGLFGFSEAAPLVTKYESHPIVQPLRGLPTIFPFARSMDVKSQGKASVDRLFATRPDSVATTNLTSAEIDLQNAKQGPHVLGAAGSYDTGQKNNPGRFVVVGSSGWAQNGPLSVTNIANRDLLLNMLNWLSSDEDLISIRPKEQENRTIAMTGSRMLTLQAFSQVLLPLAFLVLGGVVWWRRR